MGDDLVQFLRDRLDEDERQARAAMIYQDANWRVEISGIITTSAETDVYTDDRELAQHIARHDPARVLAEVEAKRALLDSVVCAEYDHEYWANRPSANSEIRTQMEARWSVWAFVLSQLVKPYVDHPDYREEWRP